MSANAAHWVKHCQNLCASWEVTLLIERIDVKLSTETQAREQRYKAFLKYIGQGDCLVLAHHNNDNMETLMLNLLRGSGVAGLRGMPMCRSLGAGTLVRPFLKFQKREILDYAKHYNLNWIDDHSNANTDIKRNFLRNNLFPLIEQKFDLQQLQMSQTWVAQDFEVLKYYAGRELQKLAEQKADFGSSICWRSFMQLPLLVRQHILRFWCYRDTQRFPSHKVLFEALQQLQQPKTSMVVAIGSWRLCYFQQRIYFVCLPKKPIARQTVKVEGDSRVEYIHISSAVRLELELKPRELGLRCTPLHRSNSQKLKKLLQQYRVPTYLRPWLVLVYCEEELISVAGAFDCDIKAQRLRTNYVVSPGSC